MSSIKCTIKFIVDANDREEATYKYNGVFKHLDAVVKLVESNHRHYKIKLFNYKSMQNEYKDQETVCDLQLIVDGDLTELELKNALEVVINEFRVFEYVFDCQYSNIDIIDCKLPVEKTRKVIKKQGNEVSEITEKNGTGRKIFILKE